MSSGDEMERPRRGLRKLAWILGLLVLLLVVVRLGLGAWGGHRLEAAAAAWKDDPDYQALSAMQATVPNGSALRLQQLAAALGIDIGERTPDRVPPNLATTIPDKDLSTWLKSRPASDGSMPPPPAEVTGFLSVHAAEIDALIAHLVTEEPPQWTRDRSRGFEARIPNLLGHMKIMRLLLASALVDDAAGQRDRSMAALDATWHLTDSLASRPEMISCLIRIAMLRNLAAALRHADVPEEPMSGRLAALDMREVVHRGSAGEALATLEFGRSGRGAAEALGLDEDAASWAELMQPRRLLVAKHVETMRELTGDFNALDPCTGSPSGVTQARIESLPPWHFLSKTLIPNMDGDWIRALQADLELALTRSVLASRQALAAGSPPPDPIPLRCEDWVFREERLPDGGFRLSFEGEVPWTLEPKALTFPLTHVEPGRVPPAL